MTDQGRTAVTIPRRMVSPLLYMAASALFEYSQEAIILADHAEAIVAVNRAFTVITGFDADEVIGNTPGILKSDRHLPEFYSDMWRLITETGHWHGEIWNRRSGGEIFPALLSINAISASDGTTAGYVAQFSDLSRNKDSENQLDYLLWNDPLTDLPNRYMFCSHLSQAISRAQRTGLSMALLHIDLDNFKDINSTLGHLAGDFILRTIGERLRRRMRGNDLVARLGGDEFILLLEALEEPSSAAVVAENIINIISDTLFMDTGEELRIGASIGISIYPDHSGEPMELLRMSDSAMFKAKSNGRSGFAFFTEELTSSAMEKINLGNRLRRAVESNELQAVYQPQLDLTTGRIVGAEALMRWNNRELGSISPGRFIPVAEQTGCIAILGEWILRETCQQGRRWLDMGFPPLTLAVNLSPRQFQQPDIIQVISKILEETGFPPHLLELELTESALMQYGRQTVKLLENLHSLGIRLALDDFGTGYSSLAYLKYFPLNLLKIDKSFVDDIPHGPKDMKLVNTIIAMAKGMEFKVLAEGVERHEQLETLGALGCDMYQGYLLSRPLSGAGFAEFCRAHELHGGVDKA